MQAPDQDQPLAEEADDPPRQGVTTIRATHEDLAESSNLPAAAPDAGEQHLASTKAQIEALEARLGSLRAAELFLQNQGATLSALEHLSAQIEALPGAIASAIAQEHTLGPSVLLTAPTPATHSVSDSDARILAQLQKFFYVVAMTVFAAATGAMFAGEMDSLPFLLALMFAVAAGLAGLACNSDP
jgi:hypothetical protein